MISESQAPASADPLANLVDELAARLQAGEAVDLDAVVRQHPEHAERLRQLLPALEVLAELGRSLSGENGARSFPTPASAELISGVLGDFRILREIGRGGMGVVYEAEQVSLRRRVALKVLYFAAALDARHLQRFKYEAQAAALLHHTNIVPVYAIGCERGVHYYAMQFIDGRTLAEVLAELRQADDPLAESQPHETVAQRHESTPEPGGTKGDRPRPTPELIARLGLQAAEALEHAHQFGVVHRDIKPANLLVESDAATRGHGDAAKEVVSASPRLSVSASPRLWITDFGLARLHTDMGLTATGDLLGTLRYMSPEQALAKRGLVDHRTDIYALGATLYELLTLRTPFEGRDREELLRQIADTEPTPPRRIDPSIPIDLETIVLKAMAKEPARRYATAQEMADDLRAFLEQKPIRARRPPLWERLSLWMRRHPAIVRSAAAVLVMAVIVLSVSTAIVNHERAKAIAERDQAVRQRQLVRHAMQDLMDSVDALVGRYRQPVKPRESRFAGVERIFEELEAAPEIGADPALRLEIGRAYRTLGDVHRQLAANPETAHKDDKARAEQAYARALPLLEKLVQDFPKVRAYREELARCYTYRSVWGGSGLEQLRAKKQSLRQGLELWEQLEREFPNDTHYQKSVAGVHAVLAGGLSISPLSSTKQEIEEADKHYDQALIRLQKVARQAPDDRFGSFELQHLYFELITYFKSTNRPWAAEQAERKHRELVSRWMASASRQLPGAAKPAPKEDKPLDDAEPLGLAQFDLKVRVRRSMGGDSYTPVRLIRQPGVQELLQVTKEEAKQIAAHVQEWLDAEEAFYTDLAQLEPKDRSRRESDWLFKRPADKPFEDKLRPLLGETRYERLLQIRLQVRGPSSIPAHKQTLGLSPEQEQQMKQLVSLLSLGMSESRQTPGAFQKSVQDYERRLFELLTPEQQTKWRQLIGEPIDEETRKAIREGVSKTFGPL